MILSPNAVITCWGTRGRRTCFAEFAVSAVAMRRRGIRCAACGLVADAAVAEAALATPDYMMIDIDVVILRIVPRNETGAFFVAQFDRYDARLRETV